MIKKEPNYKIIFRKDIQTQLERKGFHFKDVKFLDGYFIFEHGKNSVVHFYIKECSGWKFGVWFGEDDETKAITYDIFAQYEETIDKFKPTASSFVMKDMHPSSFYALDRITEMIRYISKHPSEAFYFDTYICSSFWEIPSRFECWREKTKADHHSRQAKKVYTKLEKRYSNLLRLIAEEALEGGRVLDNNKGGWHCSPRFMIVGEKFKSPEVAKQLPVYSGQFIYESLSDELYKKYLKYQKMFKKYAKVFDLEISDLNPEYQGLLVRPLKKEEEKKHSKKGENI